MNYIIYLNAFQYVIWLALIIILSVVIYSWTKSKISNNTFSIIITLLIIYLVFIQYPDFVWFVVLGVVVYYVIDPNFKKIFKDFKI
jgi:chromate transport protein ChrA